jgi:hypothetical protein
VGKIKIEPEIIEPGVIVKPERMSWLHVIGRWCNQLAKPWFVQFFFFELFKYCRPTANEELPFCLATRLGVFPQPRFRFSTHHLTLDCWCLVVTCVLLENDYAIAKVIINFANASNHDIPHHCNPKIKP